MEEERREHVTKMKKMEMEMEQVFEMKVKEKVQKLRDSEAEVTHRIISLWHGKIVCDNVDVFFFLQYASK